MTETFFSVLLPYTGLVLYFLCAVWKRKEPMFPYLVAGGIIFTISVGCWGFVTRHFLEESEFVREEYGVFWSSFFLDWYFVYFHLLVLLGFVYLVIRRVGKHSP